MRIKITKIFLHNRDQISIFLNNFPSIKKMLGRNFLLQKLVEKKFKLNLRIPPKKQKKYKRSQQKRSVKEGKTNKM